MPRIHKLTAAEIAALSRRPPGARAQVAREYDEFLANFAIGDYGRVDLAEGERRTSIFWILDFGFWIGLASTPNPKSKIGNPKSEGRLADPQRPPNDIAPHCRA